MRWLAVKKNIYLGKSAGWVKHTRNSDLGGKRGVNKKIRRGVKADSRAKKAKLDSADASIPAPAPSATPT